MQAQNGLKWPQFFFLAFVFVLGIFVPLTWHRQHGRHPIEPLGTRNRSSQPATSGSTGTVNISPSTSFASWNPDAHPEQDFPVEPNSAVHPYRRVSRVVDFPPNYQRTAWPVPHAILEKLDLLEQAKETKLWATQVRKQLTDLNQCKNLTDKNVSTIFAGLQNAIDTAGESAPPIDQGNDAYQLNAVCYDLTRRLAIWQAVHHISSAFPKDVFIATQPFLDESFLKQNPQSDKPADFLLDLCGFLAAVEQYEFFRLNTDGAKIANLIDPLLESPHDAQRSLGQAIDLHYRNANLRIAAKGDFMNRLLPTTQSANGRISDTILGVPVQGNSRTRTTLHTRLIPDPHRIRIGMEASGYVLSDTVASTRNVYLYNEGETAFLVRKLILIDHGGVKTKPTVAEALSESELIDIETNYDNIPFVGAWVRNAARRQHAENHDASLSETEYRVASQARQTFDRQLDPRLHKGIDGFYHELWKPLEQLGLEPTAVQLSTTEKRVVSRLRLGHSGQLTGSSARPRAMSNSMLSMQFHETAVNNGLEQLGLAGKTFSLHDLYLYVMGKIGRRADEAPESMSKKVKITFSSHNPIRVRCDNDAVTLIMSLRQVTKGTKYKWSNLRVSAQYGIESDGVEAFLVRQHSIRLEGKKLRTRDQIALRGVFSKLLSRENQLPLVPKKITSNPHMSNLAVIQKQVQDGWIGLAIGPRSSHTAVSHHSARSSAR